MYGVYLFVGSPSPRFFGVCGRWDCHVLSVGCVVHLFVALAHHWMQVCKTILCSAVGLTYGSTDLLLFMRFTFFLMK